MAAAANPLPRPSTEPKGQDSKSVVLGQAANEFVFAVVGHVGSGTSLIAETLKERLSETTLDGGPFDVEILKASSVIKAWALENKQPIPTRSSQSLAYTTALQDLGDKMRSALTVNGPDHSAVARRLILKVRESRAAKTGTTVSTGDPVAPDGKRRAYILDSLRNPAEVHLLRHVYQDAFVLIGVVCEESKRLSRLQQGKYQDDGRKPIEAFMLRDAEAKEKYGQQVADTFHLSDFFVDNTIDRYVDPDKKVGNPDWDTNDRLSRLVSILTHSEIVRPEMAEIAMHHARGAMMQSACLSRQVGAALVDQSGNVVATGTNEVPKAGGGVYGELRPDAPTSSSRRSQATPGQFTPAQFTMLPAADDRCAYRADKYCSNTREQNDIILKLIEEVPELNSASPERKEQLRLSLRKTKIGSLLEFSRAVHAEMDALFSAARQGISPVGTRLYVTTYPCHYCARHLVASGVDEVQFIEPYPKSLAIELHSDAIQTTAKDWLPPSQGGTKVLFRPFSGVAPRLFNRAFLKDRPLKDKNTGVLKIDAPDWGAPWHLRKESYVTLEALLEKDLR